MFRAVIALGSNISPRKEHLRKAVDHIERIEESRIAGRSRIYETDPVGGPEQGMFLNAALALETTLSAENLLQRLLEIERSMGRVRTVRNGPRNIDLDIIFHDDTCHESPNLTLPHPRFRDRAFVLLPLNDIAANVRDPITDQTVAELLEELVRRDEPVYSVEGSL